MKMTLCIPHPLHRGCLVCGTPCFEGECECLPPATLPVMPASGPGTELKKLLAKIGISESPTCSCNARAAEMNLREQETPGWCEANLDKIVGWLREQAEARGLPFLDLAGRLLVRRAIQNARKADAGS